MRQAGRAGRQRGIVGFSLGVIGAFLAMLAVGVAPASALQQSNWLEGHSTEQQQAITDFYYDQGPQGVTP